MRHLALIAAILFALNKADCLNQCEHSPRWRLNKVTFPNDFPGQVKFVALLKASCNFCRTQAKKFALFNSNLKKLLLPCSTCSASSFLFFFFFAPLFDPKSL